MSFANPTPSLIGSAITLVLAAMCAVIPDPAQAQTGGALYGRIDGGYSPAGNTEITVNAPIGGDVSLKDGFVVSGGIGYAFANGLRIEGEVSHRENGLKAGPLVDPGGKIRATSLMANVYYDFGGRESMLNPYLGAGVGAAFSKLKANNSQAFIPLSIDKNATSFAYQLMAGLGIGVSDNIDLDVGYRYFKATSINGHARAQIQIGQGIPFEADYQQHAATAGLRFRF